MIAGHCILASTLLAILTIGCCTVQLDQFFAVMGNKSSTIQVITQQDEIETLEVTSQFILFQELNLKVVATEVCNQIWI